ncbi:hypothetical protein SLA2020_049390 [Shorea laevis]
MRWLLLRGNWPLHPNLSILKTAAEKWGFVTAGVESQTDGGMKPVVTEDIDMPEESDSKDEERVEIAQKDVPPAVFRGLARKRDDGDRDGGR